MSAQLTLRFNEDRYPVVEVNGVFDAQARRQMRDQLRDAGHQGIEVQAFHMPKGDYEILRREMRKRFALFQDPLLTIYGTPLAGIVGIQDKQMRIYGERRRDKLMGLEA